MDTTVLPRTSPLDKITKTFLHTTAASSIDPTTKAKFKKLPPRHTKKRSLHPMKKLPAHHSKKTSQKKATINALIFLPLTTGTLFLGITLYVTVTMFDTSDNDVSLGPMYKLFGSGFESPQSLTWSKERGILYFMDPNSGNIYEWKPSYGKYKYQYVYAKKSKRVLYNSLLGSLFGPQVVFEIKSLLPTDDPETFFAGFGPDVCNIYWYLPHDSKRQTKWKTPISTRTADVFEKHQEISVAKASPLGSVLLGRDTNILAHSRARLASYYDVSVIYIQQPYPKGFFPKHVYISGLTWSVNNQTIYILDTVTWSIISWKYKLSGKRKLRTSMSRTPVIQEESISDPELLVSFTDKPFDVVVDGENHLWVTLMGSNQVARVSTSPEDVNQRIKAVYKTPGKVTYGIVIGGPNMDTLIVSTGHRLPSGLTAKGREEVKKLGNFYALNVSVKAGPVYQIMVGYIF